MVGIIVTYQATFSGQLLFLCCMGHPLHELVWVQDSYKRVRIRNFKESRIEASVNRLRNRKHAIDVAGCGPLHSYEYWPNQVGRRSRKRAYQRVTKRNFADVSRLNNRVTTLKGVTPERVTFEIAKRIWRLHVEQTLLAKLLKMFFLAYLYQGKNTLRH